MDWFLNDFNLRFVCDQLDGLISDDALRDARRETYIRDIVKPTSKDGEILCVAMDMVARRFSIRYGYDIGLAKFAVIYHVLRRHDEILQEREQDREIGIQGAAKEWLYNIASSRLQGPV